MACPTNGFPLKQENPADENRKRLPCVKGVGPQGLRDCRLPSKKHAKPLGKCKLKYCELVAALLAPRAGGGTPPTGCKASGENSKKGVGGFISIHAFFVFIVPVVLFLFRLLILHAETPLFDTIVCRTLGPGAMPLVGAGAA